MIVVHWACHECRDAIASSELAILECLIWHCNMIASLEANAGLSDCNDDWLESCNCESECSLKVDSFYQVNKSWWSSCCWCWSLSKSDSSTRSPTWWRWSRWSRWGWWSLADGYSRSSIDGGGCGCVSSFGDSVCDCSILSHLSFGCGGSSLSVVASVGRCVLTTWPSIHINLSISSDCQHISSSQIYCCWTSISWSCYYFSCDRSCFCWCLSSIVYLSWRLWRSWRWWGTSCGNCCGCGLYSASFDCVSISTVDFSN